MSFNQNIQTSEARQNGTKTRRQHNIYEYGRHCCDIGIKLNNSNTQKSPNIKFENLVMELLFQGAESKIYLNEKRTVLIKERFAKKYRNEQLDSQLTKKRIKAEAKNMTKCLDAGIATPKVHKIDIEKRQIYMEYFSNSRTVKKFIDQHEAENNMCENKLKDIASKIGEGISKMHAKDIVHGDLTTSNILLVEDKIVFIDFGLSAASASNEDKGVDLYVLERALLSTHEDAEKIFTAVLDSYKNHAGKGSEKVLVKFEEVRARGRKRTMVG